MDVQRGMLVAGPDGRIGTVSDVVYECRQCSGPHYGSARRWANNGTPSGQLPYRCRRRAAECSGRKAPVARMTQPIAAGNTGYETRSFATRRRQADAGGRAGCHPGYSRGTQRRQAPDRARRRSGQ